MNKIDTIACVISDYKQGHFTAEEAMGVIISSFSATSQTGGE